MLTGKDVLHSYIYIEGELNKVGNDLVLCLMDDFNDMGCLSGPNFGELIICADNCVGQKKYDYYLVHSLASKYSIIFWCNIGFFFPMTYKNDSDLLFDLLKGGYPGRYISTRNNY